MATTRISASIRDHVVESALSTKFAVTEGEIELLKIESNRVQAELHELAYEACFSKRERELMSSLPSGWLAENSVGQVMIDDKVTVIGWGRKRPVPHIHGEHHYGTKPVLAILEPDSPYCRKKEEHRLAEEAHDQKRRGYNEERRALRARIIAIVNSVTTVNRLIEIWPEVVDFLPETVSDPITGVPAVMIADLNRDLGIPSKSKTQEAA